MIVLILFLDGFHDQYVMVIRQILLMFLIFIQNKKDVICGY